MTETELEHLDPYHAADPRQREAARLGARLAAAYAALGLRRGTDVQLPLPRGCSPTSDVRDEMRLIELGRPWVALVRRDGHPLPARYVVAGDTRDDVLRRVPRARLGPNGPIDEMVWLRQT
jgi:hypothetical protein